ncbi:MAG: acylneuraminate cytidylyltransferase family protein [Anaerolineae bacterium]|nr:acylneuraminate cytidylyltransferase family protein [Anaerolineae bacterium]
MKTIVGIIPARGGSKTIPRKNVQPFLGKPLIAWTIESALNSQVLDRVIVSTEDEEIAGIAQEYGAEVPFLRPDGLAHNSTPLIKVILHAIDWLESQDQMPDGIMMLSPTNPLRAPEDIQAAVRMVRENNAVSVASMFQPSTNPYACGFVTRGGTVFGVPLMNRKDQRHQSLPSFMALNGAIYLASPSTFRETKALITHSSQIYTMPPERAIEVITPWDFYMAELVMRDRLAQSQEQS